MSIFTDRITNVMSHKLDKDLLHTFIVAALDEDVKGGDHTSLACIPRDQVSRGKLLVKDEGVLAGVAIAKEIFTYVDPEAQIDVEMNDGSLARYGDISFYLQCRSQALLKGERLALNLMQRLSGIASLSRQFADATADYPVTILDTRKTTPMIRFLEKWAVTIGGCSNYRTGLYDRIMIKDNHVTAAGGHSQAIEKCLNYLNRKGLSLEMTIEVRNLEELQEVLNTGVLARVMLDNFDTDLMKEAVAIIDGRLEIEASGGIKLSNVAEVAATGVNYISVGALTHSARSLDLSLKIIN